MHANIVHGVSTQGHIKAERRHRREEKLKKRTPEQVC